MLLFLLSSDCHINNRITYEFIDSYLSGISQNISLLNSQNNQRKKLILLHLLFSWGIWSLKSLSSFPKLVLISSVQFSSVAQSCPTLHDPMNHSTSGLPVHHQLPESTQTHVHWVSDAIQPSHPLSSPSPPALNLSQHQGLFKRVSSSHQVAKVLEFQLQRQSFQWTLSTDFL